jgi:hypothetical protein
MRRWQRRGVKLGEKPKGLLFHPGATGEGKAGRVNIREPLMMPRDKKPRLVGRYVGVQGLAAVKRRAAVGEACRLRGHRCPRGIEGTLPGRVSCVRNVTIPLGSGHWRQRPVSRP